MCDFGHITETCQVCLAVTLNFRTHLAHGPARGCDALTCSRLKHEPGQAGTQKAGALRSWGRHSQPQAGAPLHSLRKVLLSSSEASGSFLVSSQPLFPLLFQRGPVFGTVKTLLGTNAPHIRVPGFEFWLCLWFALPPNTHPGKQQAVGPGAPDPTGFLTITTDDPL